MMNFTATTSGSETWAMWRVFIQLRFGCRSHPAWLTLHVVNAVSPGLFGMVKQFRFRTQSYREEDFEEFSSTGKVLWLACASCASRLSRYLWLWQWCEFGAWVWFGAYW